MIIADHILLIDLRRNRTSGNLRIALGTYLSTYVSGGRLGFVASNPGGEKGAFTLGMFIPTPKTTSRGGFTNTHRPGSTVFVF